VTGAHARALANRVGGVRFEAVCLGWEHDPLVPSLGPALEVDLDSAALRRQDLNGRRDLERAFRLRGLPPVVRLEPDDLGIVELMYIVHSLQTVLNTPPVLVQVPPCLTPADAVVVSHVRHYVPHGKASRRPFSPFMAQNQLHLKLVGFRL